VAVPAAAVPVARMAAAVAADGMVTAIKWIRCDVVRPCASRTDT
jgi:hypothetical protein